MSASTDLAITLLRRFEGCRLDAYPDPASGGDPWTIGYGATGPEIVAGTRWTQAQVDADLARRVVELDAKVRGMLSVPLPDGSIAALISFAYNLGEHALHDSTLLRLINLGHARAAGDEFGKWIHAAGKVFPGLVKRRAAEREVFLGGLGAS